MACNIGLFRGGVVIKAARARRGISCCVTFGGLVITLVSGNHIDATGILLKQTSEIGRKHLPEAIATVAWLSIQLRFLVECMGVGGYACRLANIRVKVFLLC